MIFFLLVSFRITSPDKQKLSFHDILIKNQVQKEKCVDKNGVEYSSGSYDKDEYFYCEGSMTKASEMKFYNCYFHNIEMKKGSNSMLLHTKYSNLKIEYCTFIEIKYLNKMIYCDSFHTYEFVFNNNYISNCNSGNEEARVVYTDNNNNDIKNNYVFFDPSISVGQAFYLEYIDNNRYINNTVINANCGHGSAIYSTSNNNKGEFQLKDCKFTNCRGTDGSIIYIKELKKDLVIENTFFENLQNYYQNNGDLIHLIGKNDNQQLSFVDCKFRYLECDSKVGGGIGLIFYSKKSPKITFENTLFEHILHKHESIGGGAIAIDQNNDNKAVGIIINNCIFRNVSDTNNGGAIYYKTKENTISIRGSTFDHTSSSNNGNSIYIGQSNSYTVTISYCHFIDCGTRPNSYVIDINTINFDFQDSEIIFSDASNSCGCIKSNQYYEHNYLRNVFRNAHVDFPKNSAGIDESNSANSNKISITDNIFDGISGASEGRCFYINFASSNIFIDNNTIQNCPSGGILIKIELENMFTKFEFKLYKFINNSINDASFSEYQICPQIFVKNSMSSDFPDEIELVFSNCLFENNHNSKNGGAISYGKNKYNALTNMNFNNCQFRDNTAEEGGSALYIIVYQGCQISNCKFISNKAEHESGAIYIETDFDCPTISGKPTSSPQIAIDGCAFENNEGKNAGITINSSPNTPVSIKNIEFKNCGNSGHVIDIQSDVQSTIIQDCSVINTDSTYSGGISVHSNGKIEILFINFVSTSVDSALSIESDESTEKVSVTQCLFDSCTGNGYSCFYISAKTNSFEFKDITVGNVKISGCDNYLGSLNLNGKIALTLTNVSFTENSCSSLYGGGTGMIFSGISELIFDKCDFVSNEAHQDDSKSRPLANSDTVPYYNGDGGAIQIGCQIETAEMNLRFRDCNFRRNKAFRHGGAIAIQTVKELELYNCNLEQNIANYDFESSSSNLLYENYFHLKKEGRGGAIYLNPASGCVDSYTENVIINDCKLAWNNAYDGYAIYIEGDDPGTEFTVTKNNFNDNYNINNHDKNDPNIIYGAVISSEIWNFTKDTLRPPNNPENFNYFAQSNNDLKINELLHVDHSGRTKTKEFTESDYFPTEFFTKSITFTYSTYFSNSNEFSDSRQFSPSDHFPSSSYFTDSDKFTKSSQFSKSNMFSNSNLFTNSNNFLPSDNFSESRQFSSSNKFTNSNSFTKTSRFSKSDSFSNSDLFSKSEHFSQSLNFSKSAYFSESNQFSYSNKFTKSDYFTKTGEFSKTNSFSKSDPFSESNYFSKSSYFSGSNQFSNSNKFTKSDSFTKTGEFSKTNSFSESDLFSKSNYFSKSAYFSGSNQFSNSNKFTKSDYFTKTDEFSKSALFSKSKLFSESTQFSNSFYFTESNQFSNTNKFSNSDYFTKTNEFSKSALFSKSTQFSNSLFFTESNHFSNSNKFTNSDSFTKTSEFSKTGVFSETKHFSQSNLFSNSNSFTISDIFSFSNQFSNSNAFSNSDKFTNSNKFSETQIFTKSNLFSESGKFTLSNTFPPSDAFSESNRFSQTQYFSETKKFTSSSIFTYSNLFSQSNVFSESKSFSSSIFFSKSIQFSNSNKFSETHVFSFTGQFTISNNFTISHSFSHSNKFSDSLGFSLTSRFSVSDKFSFSNKFSSSQSFTISNKFSDSNAFSHSNAFEPTIQFSNSKVFSKTRFFSYSNEFSNSEKFSETHSFSTSEKFTNSDKFSPSKIFSQSSVFTDSNCFSQSDQFSTSAQFSHSNQFSPSADFSPSIPPEISEPLCGIWEDGAFTIFDNCDFVINDTKLVYIYVLATNFTDFKKEEENGGAVHLINCGIHCNDTNFIDCVSLSGAGGGIYINSTLDMTNNATFINVLFLRCKASYGGAVFIYANSDLFNISFDQCNFESNEALSTKPSNSENYLFGGSAMFVMAKMFTVFNSSFIHNKGHGSMKIYNNFDQNKKKLMLDENQNTIFIHSCKFKEEENSKGSINYVEEKYGVNIDIIDCKFQGNIKKGSYYINGRLNNKEKLHVSSCNFKNGIDNSVNIKLINNKLPSITDKKDQSIQGKNNVAVIITIIIIFTLIIFIFNINRCYNNSQKINDDISKDSIDFMTDISL